MVSALSKLLLNSPSYYGKVLAGLSTLGLISHYSDEFESSASHSDYAAQ